MSNNYNTVASQAPDRTGAITVSLSDVTSVSNPTLNQALSYDGTSWKNATLSILDSYERSAYSYSINPNGPTNASTIFLSYSTTQPRFYRFYNKQTNGSVYADIATTTDVEMLADVSSGSSGLTIWYRGFKFLTAGVYRICAKIVVGPNSTDTSFIDLQLSNEDNTVTFGPKVRVGNVNTKQKNIIGIVNASANDEIGFYKHSIIGAPKYAKLGDPNIIVTVEKLS